MPPTFFTDLTRELRVATLADHPYVRQLQKRHAGELGFIPDQGTLIYIERGRVLLALENGEPAGMILGHEHLQWCIAMRPIFQAAIQYDARRRHHGLALVARAEADAREAGQLATQACCREGLEANAFWKIAGYEEICRLDPQSARNRSVIVWRKQLNARHRPKWFNVVPPRAGYRARNTNR
jgi:N-acetylglutamate synthase-like GNAT family acetyltransferase